MADEGKRARVSPDELSEFTRTNPESEIYLSEDVWTIEKPWGDDTVIFQVAPDDKELVDALNHVRLPKRFTAIWHRDTGDVEFIFGPLSAKAEIRKRAFTFLFNQEQYKCEYGDASNRLRVIALCARPSGPPSETDNRHLILVRSFLRRLNEVKGQGREHNFILTSFWVRGVMIEEDNLLDLARHLNFYMSYFDRFSPRIIIHSDLQPDEPLRRLTLPHFDFPVEIAGMALDPYMLGLWESGMTARDEIRLFLHSYQVLEYAAFYYIREEMLTAFRRLIKAPDIGQRTEQICREALDLLAEDRISDEQKIVEIVRRAVNPERIWTHVESRRDYFSEQHIFEGGFVVLPLIKHDWQLDDFRAAWIPKLPDALRKIRNALVHAREQRITHSIAATPRNLRLLAPWAELVLAVSNEIILFGA